MVLLGVGTYVRLDGITIVHPEHVWKEKLIVVLLCNCIYYFRRVGK
jgi:hypothetical protein